MKNLVKWLNCVGKRTLLSLAFLAAGFTFAPRNVKAAKLDGVTELILGGRYAVKNGKLDKKAVPGGMVYNEKTNTLTLNQCKISFKDTSDCIAAIQYRGTKALNIVVNGTNALTCESYYGLGIWAAGNNYMDSPALKISGRGTLNITNKADADAISGGNITINGPAITTTGAGIQGTNVEIKNADITVNHTQPVMYESDKIGIIASKLSIYNSRVEVKNCKIIFCCMKKCTISGGTLYAGSPSALRVVKQSQIVRKDVAAPTNVTGYFLLKPSGGSPKPVQPVQKQEQTLKYKKSIQTTCAGTKKEYSLHVEVKGGARVSYRSSNESVAHVSSGGKVTIKKAGKATITISVAETDKYKSATGKVDVQVEKAESAAKPFRENIIDKISSIPMKYVFKADPICKEKVPQGICATNKYLLVSMYEEGESSAIVVLGKEDYSAKIVLIPDFRAHLGGITFDGKNIWVSGAGNHVIRFSASQLDGFIRSLKPGKGIEYKMHRKDGDYTEYTTDKTPSFLTYNKAEKRLCVGTFDENKSSVIHTYGYNPSADRLKSDKVFTIPDRIQGAVFNGSTLFLSQSYGRSTRSNILTGELSGDAFKTDKIFELKNASLSEGLEIVGDKLYILFESSAKKYRKIAFFTGKLQNSIWTINLKKFR